MQIARIGLDLAKYVFEIFCADAHGRTVFRKTLRRHAVLPFFANLPTCLVGMEASNGAHFWAKAISELSHDVRLISPQFVPPYVKSNKNDRNDAEAICEAVGRPNMRFVSIKSAEQLAVQAVHRIRSRLVADRVRLVNQVRGLLGEQGIVVARDIGNLRRALARIVGDDEYRALNPLVRTLMGELREELTELDARIARYDRKIREALSQQRDLPASRQGRRDRPGDGDSAGRCGRRPKLVQERASVCGVAWACAQTAIERRPRQIIRHQ
jgi:transposase